MPASDSAPAPTSPTRDVPLWSALELCVLALCALLFVALARYHWQYVVDDAFITFRYVRNLLAGHGPVWNPGEAVEGFSSPLWLGLLAVGAAAGLPLPMWAGALGVGSVLVTLVIVHRATWKLTGSRLAAAIACLTTVLGYPLWYWAAAGLETTLFAALMTASVAALLGGSTRWLPVIAGCLGVARPEGPFLVLVLLGLTRLAHGRAALGARKAALALLPMLAWLVFRRAFYREWLPNSYYAKATGDLLWRTQAGFLYAIWGIIAWMVVATSVWFAGAVRAKIAAAMGFLAFALAIVVAEGGDWMWHARLIAPLLSGFVIMAAVAVASGAPRRKWIALFACVLSWTAFAPGASVLADALTGKRMPALFFQEGTLAQASFAVAKFIADRYPSTAVVAVNHAGALPYALPNPAIDMAGLCDWHIAHERKGGVHHKFDGGYVFARRPDLVVLNTKVRPGMDGVWYHPGYWEGETALVKQPGWTEAYRPVEAAWESHWMPGEPTYLVLFERVAK